MRAKPSFCIQLAFCGLAAGLIGAVVGQENTPPTLPGEIQVSEVTAHSARLSWGASTDANGDVVAYLVALRRRIGGVAQPWSTPRDTRDTSLVWDGLSAGTIYEVQVRATDGRASSAARLRENAFTTLIEPGANHAPSIPGEITVTAITAHGCRVSWGAATDADGDSLRYHVSLRKRIEGVAQEWLAARDTTATSVAYDGLDPETLYDVRVRASDGLAFSPWRVRELAFRTPALNNGPTQPGEITVSEVTARSARIAWERATAPGTGPIAYELLLRSRLEGVAQPWVRVAETTNNYRVVDGLSGNTVYDVKVRAWANGVASAYTVKENAFITLRAADTNVVPTVPGTIVVTNLTSTGAQISWGASTDGDGDPITYEVCLRQRIETVAQPWSEPRAVAVTALAWGELSPNTLYEVRVRASDGKSVSTYRIKENAFRTLPVGQLTGLLERGAGTSLPPKLIVLWPVSGAGVFETADSLESPHWVPSQEIETDGVQNRLVVPVDSRMRFLRLRQ